MLYVAVANFAWGTGNTEAEAIEHCRKHIVWPYVKGKARLITCFTDGDSVNIDPVNGTVFPIPGKTLTKLYEYECGPKSITKKFAFK